MQQRVRVLIGGRVQGVGFREWTKRQAQAAGVAGWVKNLSDGRVEALLEGDTVKVSQLMELLRRGPALARVDTFDIETFDTAPATAVQEVSGFEVRRN